MTSSRWWKLILNIIIQSFKINPVKNWLNSTNQSHFWKIKICAKSKLWSFQGLSSKFSLRKLWSCSFSLRRMKNQARRLRQMDFSKNFNSGIHFSNFSILNCPSWRKLKIKLKFIRSKSSWYWLTLKSLRNSRSTCTKFSMANCASRSVSHGHITRLLVNNSHWMTFTKSWIL